ncbi:MAG: ferric reductase-like transmembrane domain-containing protein [Acidimicrobiia bacterium]
MTLDPKTWWYVTRATGFVSWALLAVAVLWGLFITNKTLNRSTAPAWVLDLHRHLGGLAVVFVAVHVAALPLDGFTDWGWSDLFVPMATSWNPGATAWGIVGMYVLVAIELTSLLGRRFPKKWWRRVHMLSFPLYVIASIHLFAAGTDSGNVVVTWMVVTTSTLIAFLTVVRALGAAKPRETRANPRTAAARAHALGAAANPGAEARARATRAATGDLLPGATELDVPARASLRVRLGTPTLADRITRLHEQTEAAARHARDVTTVS